MAKKAQAASQPSPYEVLGMRIQRVINSPNSQKSKSALLERSANDQADDWSRVIEEIGENDNVTLAHRDDGSVQLFWTAPKED